MAVPLRCAALWKVMDLVDRRPVMQQPPERVRASSRRRQRLTRIPLAKVVTGGTHPGAAVAERSFPGPDGTDLGLRIYRPRDAVSTTLPVVVNFHGGGWVSGDPYQSEWWCSSVAVDARVAVVSVDYRLAPEHPYPAAPEDCYAAVRWVVEHAADLAVDGTRLAVMGDSAGGNLAAVVAMIARDRGGPAIALQVLIYPSVELEADFPSERENAHAPVLKGADLDNTPRLYVPDATRRKEPYASPLCGKHDGLPPALIQTAQHDPLRDHGPAYAEALRAAGVPVRLTNYVDAVHGYISMPHVVPAARQALAEAVEEIRAALG